jgi:electron transfer flavoprotein beta subunit
MSPNPASRVAVLLSIGQHPVTARSRRADQDARALELALQLNNADVIPLHVGNLNEQNEAALRSYIGMGVSQIKIIENSDILLGLEQGVRDSQANIVLCGSRAETGEGSGLVPYLLAKKLGWPIVSGMVSIEKIEQGSAILLQALPRGQRRKLKVSLPAVLAVDPAAAVARQSAFGPAQRGVITPQKLSSTEDVSAAQVKNNSELESSLWQFQPAKKRPKRLKIIKATSARDRFKAAAAKADASGGKVLQGVSADDAANEIIKLLLEEGVLNLDSHL